MWRVCATTVVNEGNLRLRDVVKLGCPIISWQRRFINFESLHPQHCLEDILLGAKFFFQFKSSISHVGCLKSHERIYKAIQISVWDACSKCRSTKLDTWVLVPLFQGWSTWTKLEYKIAVLWQKSSLKFLLWNLLLEREQRMTMNSVFCLTEKMTHVVLKTN